LVEFSTTGRINRGYCSARTALGVLRECNVARLYSMSDSVLCCHRCRHPARGPDISRWNVPTCAVRGGWTRSFRGSTLSDPTRSRCQAWRGISALGRGEWWWTGGGLKWLPTPGLSVPRGKEVPWCRFGIELGHTWSQYGNGATAVKYW